MKADMKMYRMLGLGALCAALAACVTVPASGPAAPTGPASIPSSPLDLGDWRRASAEATLGQFQQNLTSRYGAGLPIGAVVADLRGADFSCSAPRAASDNRGDPPAQVCRKTTTVSGCTHTWQAHLFDAGNDARLARARGLYDRRCGNDGLLGGPS